ncbi:MAG: cytochrome c3 family protein, partial [Pseudomonadota bacterium]
MSAAIGGYLAAGLLDKAAANSPWLAPARSMLLPGKTSHGHHQIELACETCHGAPFGGRAALQESCERCHGAELKRANDTHPRSKFTDPRNADRLEKLEATLCVTCHVEHRPGITLAMGVTRAADFCFHCHADIARDRPSHAGLGFDSCNSAGCHKYHDNRALYEDFLLKHLTDPPQAANPRLPQRSLREALGQNPGYPAQKYPLRALAAGERDAPAAVIVDAALERDWLETAHARAGVNCSGCHGGEGPRGAWVERPGPAACRQCHAEESAGFLAGKHGMRLAAGLSPMTPSAARLPMRKEAAARALGCTSCHAAHRFDTRRAAAEACLGCHQDRHSLAYKGSAHEALWKKELAGELPAGSGVSCASCH